MLLIACFAFAGEAVPMRGTETFSRLLLPMQAQRERVVAADAKRQHLTVSASDAANWQVCLQVCACCMP